MHTPRHNPPEDSGPHVRQLQQWAVAITLTIAAIWAVLSLPRGQEKNIAPKNDPEPAAVKKAK